MLGHTPMKSATKLLAFSQVNHLLARNSLDSSLIEERESKAYGHVEGCSITYGHLVEDRELKGT